VVFAVGEFESTLAEDLTVPTKDQSKIIIDKRLLGDLWTTEPQNAEA